MTDVTGNPEEERRVDYYYQPWVTEGVCRCVLKILNSRSNLNHLEKDFNIMLDLAGTSMERFNKSGLNWTQAWVCAIPKETGKILNVSSLTSWNLMGLLYILKGVAPSDIDIINTICRITVLL